MVGGSLILFCSFGIVNCSGVFVQYYVNGPLSDYSSSAITWITSVQAFLITGSNLVMGRIFDSYGTRWILPLGTVFYALGLMLLSLSTEYYQIILTQGIVCGIGAAAVFNCASNSTLTWFFRRRAAALGIVVAGSSVGGIVLPILYVILRSISFFSHFQSRKPRFRAMAMSSSFQTRRKSYSKFRQLTPSVVV